MRKRSKPDDWDGLRERILGLGEASARKSYYPTLRRKLADLERAEEELRTVNARLQALVNTTPDWIWELDATGRYVYSSPQVEELLGYRPEEVLGRTPFDFMAPGEAARLRPLVDSYFRAGRPIRGVLNANVHRDGHEVIIETSGMPVLDADGVVTGFRGADRDVTARVRGEEERREMEAQMLHAQKLESLGVLAGGIAHDFNNLLTAILGNAQLARIDDSVRGDTAARLDDVIRTSERAADLCRQMLAYSGRGRFQLERIHLSALVRDMAEILQVSIAKKVTLRLDLAPDLPPVSGDATQLRQVVMNLITNASEAIGDAPGLIWLSTSVSDDQGRSVLLRIADDGCGMDAETRARLFEPFFTTKFAGRGLGMAAVLGIVQGHGGTIQVQSSPGEGSRFEVALPPVDGVVEPTGTASPAARAWRGSGRVLLAEDEPAVRQLTERILARLGFDVVAAADGREAMEAWTAGGDAFDVVVLDMTMPELGGLEVLDRIGPSLGERPVILTSGYTGNEVLNHLPAGRAVTFLQKPFTVAALRRAIQQALEPAAD